MHLTRTIIEKSEVNPGSATQLLPVNDVLRDPVSDVLSEVVNDVLRDHIPTKWTRSTK